VRAKFESEYELYLENVIKNAKNDVEQHKKDPSKKGDSLR